MRRIQFWSDSWGCTLLPRIHTVGVKSTGTMDITQFKPQADNISIYANPFKNQLTVTMDVLENAKMVITDVLGKKVYSAALSQKVSVFRTDKSVYSDKMVRSAKLIKVN